MATAKERLRIFENVIARVGLDGDVLGEFAKALNSINGLQAYNDFNIPQVTTPQNLTPQGSDNAVSAPMSPEMGQTTTPTETMSETP
jgi:hypothetical protein